MRRVLLIVEFFPPHVGGGETLFGNLASGLAGRGDEVTVITTAVKDAPRRERWHGVDVIRIATPFFSRYAFMALALPAALRHARRADIVHTTTYNAAATAWLASRVARKPCVITVHEIFGPQWNQMAGMNRLVGYAYRIFEWTTMRLPFARYICVSDHTRRRLVEYVGVDPKRTAVVHNSIDYEFWDPAKHRARPLRTELELPADTFIYLYFGRPGVSKGVEDLLDAAAIVRDRAPNAKLVMILSREPAAQYARLRKRIDALRDHVILIESVKRDVLPSYLLAANVVVVPSLSEGFGYAAVEAATLGCHVISTTGHAVEEVLATSATYVPQRDPVHLAEAIVSVSRGEKSVAPAPHRYTQEALVDGISRLYEEVPGRRSEASARPTPGRRG